MLPFYIPWKNQKTFGFLVFLGSIKSKHWSEMLKRNFLLAVIIIHFTVGGMRYLKEVKMRVVIIILFSRCDNHIVHIHIEFHLDISDLAFYIV